MNTDGDQGSEPLNCDHVAARGSDALIERTHIGALRQGTTYRENYTTIQGVDVIPDERSDVCKFGLSGSDRIIFLPNRRLKFVNVKKLIRDGMLPPDNRVHHQSSECCVCMDAIELSSFLPCAHSSVCNNCVHKLKQNEIVKCPLCRDRPICIALY